MFDVDPFWLPEIARGTASNKITTLETAPRCCRVSDLEELLLASGLKATELDELDRLLPLQLLAPCLVLGCPIADRRRVMKFN
jgi:hypothetical protein